MSASEDDYVCTLNEKDLKKAKKELYEDPENRLGAVQALQEWMKQQPYINNVPDTRYLIRFLRTAKFSQLRAREMITNYLTSLTTTPNWMQGIDVADPKIIEIMKTGYFFNLGQDKEGREVMFIRASAMDPSKCESMKDSIMKCGFAVYYWLLNREYTQVNGFSFCVDFTGISMKHVSFWTIDELKRQMKIFQDGFPMRLKAFHYYNVGPIGEPFIEIYKMFMKKKLKDRIHIHNTMEKVYKYIPQEILPEEYLPDEYTGKSGGSIQDCIDRMIKGVTEESNRQRILQYSSAMYTIDMDKLPDKETRDEPQASFRKLNVE